ncbi:MAG TPA: Asp-tRNA(Asn)/Glu-tRNA(Gln) amidotransferase subunit GatA [Chitinophagaceae bacterium]
MALPEFSSVKEYHQLLQLGKLTCAATVQYYLERIEQYKHLNAFVRVYGEEALARAEQIDAAIEKGEVPDRLTGVVIGIKDVICYKGHPVTAASKILSGFESLYSATAVERLLAAGAIIIGHQNCDEFAMGSTSENSAYGIVLNARDPSRVPGGSSGGSAVAVQAGLCMLSLGSDTGGSVRQPADFCGIIGLKPTYGRISRHGLIAYASSFDQIGIFGRNIADVATVLEVIAGPDEYDETASQTQIDDYQPILPGEKKYRIAWLRDALHHEGLDSEIRARTERFFDTLKTAGHTVEPVDFEYLDVVVPAYYVLTTAEASSNLSRYDGIKYGYSATEKNLDLVDFYKHTRSAGFGKEVKRRILLGTFVLSAGYYDAYFTKAQQVRRLVAEKTEDILSRYDCILLPTVPVTAFRIGEKMMDPVAMYAADIYTVFANLVGVPAISVPLFKHSNGLPFGIQVITGKFGESSLLNISYHLMSLPRADGQALKEDK